MTNGTKGALSKIKYEGSKGMAVPVIEAANDRPVVIILLDAKLVLRRMHEL